MSGATLRKGTRFLHRRLLAEKPFDGKTPQLCAVTRIANGWIYYRPVYAAGTAEERLGNPGCFDSEESERFVGEIQ